MGRMMVSTIDSNELTVHFHRRSQELPDYTSPPTEVAINATPEAFRSDAVIDEARNASAAGLCSAEHASSHCHIPFPAAFGSSEVGVILYCGALVDPRGYAPLAKILSERYGVPVVIPIFDNDLAFTMGVCSTGRLKMAQAEFENVKKWVFVGHSFGGVGAAIDVWHEVQQQTLEAVGGLVMMAADVQDLGCGDTNFNQTNLPMAIVTASEDLQLNMTRWESNRFRASNRTFFLDVWGGNHRFGSYDETGRFDVLGQVYGVPMIPDRVQWEITVGAIYHVASRTGAAIPDIWTERDERVADDSPTSAAQMAGPHGVTGQACMLMLLFLHWFGKKK